MKHGLLECLHEIVGGPGLLLGTGTKAVAVVRPRSTEQVSRILAACNASGQAVVIQGDTSGVRETRARPGDIVLSLERMDAIERIDPFNRTALVQAGVALQSLQERVAGHGLSFPLEFHGPGPRRIGGNAAANTGGTDMIRYGPTRHHVLGLEVVLADGRIISSLNQVMTGNAGYDLKQLFIGSEGTLGVITRLVLRLNENPACRSTALVSVEHFDQLIRLFRMMERALHGSLSAFEFLDREFYALSGRHAHSAPPLADGRPLYAIIESIGFDEKRHLDLFENALRLALESGLVFDAMIARSDNDRRAIWNLPENLRDIGHHYHPFYVFNIRIPVTNMEAYMESVRRRVRKRWPDASVSFLGSIGAGNIQFALSAGMANAEDRISVEQCVHEPLAMFNGSIAAEYGTALEERRHLHTDRNHGELRFIQDLKKLFDPKGILNPGRSIVLYPVGQQYLEISHDLIPATPAQGKESSG